MVEEDDPDYKPAKADKVLEYEGDKVEKKVKVLENLDLTIEKGSFVAVLGHNGSGKSTIAKLTNGILFAESGQVIVDGQIAAEDDSIFDIRKKVGMVFQNPDNQIVSSIVEEDVAFGVENLGVPSE
ncbi:MAG: ATP-binding cassette domain-containing protein, partial [Eubacterium sp.]|nr:ATP-binding cassette domain-containing protein [Eubacterium sp.]